MQRSPDGRKFGNYACVGNSRWTKWRPGETAGKLIMRLSLDICKPRGKPIHWRAGKTTATVFFLPGGCSGRLECHLRCFPRNDGLWRRFFCEFSRVSKPRARTDLDFCTVWNFSRESRKFCGPQGFRTRGNFVGISVKNAGMKIVTFYTKIFSWFS